MKTTVEKTRGYRRIIPSMTALVEFEAVARLSSFTMAAHELGVTQAAVSRQVKALEETLGVQLFHRLHRAIKLTREGEALQQVVSESMQKIAGVFDRLAKYPQQEQIVIAATAAFSQFRFLPRLAQLKQRLPQAQLQLTTQMFTADLLHKDIDVAIRFGSGKWPDGTAVLLFDEEVFPVCAPKWLQEHAALRRWPHWQKWRSFSPTLLRKAGWVGSSGLPPWVSGRNTCTMPFAAACIPMRYRRRWPDRALSWAGGVW